MAQHDMGEVVFVAAEAQGQPGQRRFRLKAIGADGESASLWMEKEQLGALGEAIGNVLENEHFVPQRRPLDDLEPEPPFPLSPTFDFRLARLSLGLNRDDRRLVVVAGAAPGDLEELEGISLEFGLAAAHDLQQQITSGVAAGRPPCPLCTAPMSPEGHVCVRSNGHNPH
jgi:uncharacterized repeat protein (TIGR03847 family)